MALDAAISKLIVDIYAGGSDPVIWDRALDRLLDLTNSRFVLISAVDLERREYDQTHFYGADDSRFLNGIRDYDEHFYADDPTLRFAATHPNAGTISLLDAISTTSTDFEETPYCRWVSDALGVADSTVHYSAPADRLTLGVSLHAPRERGCHSSDELRLFAMLFEHMEQSMRLVARAPDLTSELDALLLVDAKGRIRSVSAAADRLLAQNDGLAITAGRLAAGRRCDTAAIDKMISSAMAAMVEGSAGGSLRSPRPSGRRAWFLKASPVLSPPSPFEMFRPAVLIKIVDADAAAPASDVQRWRALFGLTPTEGRLAEYLLTSGGGLRDAAEALSMAYSTSRIHLSRIFEKTGAHSQSALIRLLTRI